MIRRLSLILVSLAVVASACGSDPAPRNEPSAVIINREPIAVVPAQVVVIDLDGDGVETVTLDATASRDPDPDGEVVEFRWSRGLVDLAATAVATDEFEVGEHVVTVTVRDNDGLADVQSMVVRVLEPYKGTPDSPYIDLWQGDQVISGEVTTQRWFDVVGNVSDPDGVNTLIYSLNGGVARGLDMGPNGRRLVREGDFVIDILRSELVEGPNTVEIRAVDLVGETTTALMQITVEPPTEPSLPLTVDWATQELSGLVEIIDGDWQRDGDEVTIGPEAAGYDRLLAIGDTSWTEFDVTTTVTLTEIHEDVGPFSNTPGFGFLVRWNGHSDSTTPGSQPQQGFRPDDGDHVTPIGGFPFYTFETESGILELQDHTGEVMTFDDGVQVRTGVTYGLRAQVQSNPVGAVYRAKIWDASGPEPAGWPVSYVAGRGRHEPPSGSLVLVAHELSARFGELVISPIADADRLTDEQVVEIRNRQN